VKATPRSIGPEQPKSPPYRYQRPPRSTRHPPSGISRPGLRIMLEVNFREFFFRDCPKRVGGAFSVALRSTSTVLFYPFWPPYASQIHAQIVARTPFRTVSLLDFSHS
jgi:hypothetical protein